MAEKINFQAKTIKHKRISPAESVSRINPEKVINQRDNYYLVQDDKTQRSISEENL